MGGTAIKGKSDIKLKTKYRKSNFSLDINPKSKIVKKILSTDKKYQSSDTNTYYSKQKLESQNNITKVPYSSTNELNKNAVNQENPNSRNVGKKSKLIIPKIISKAQIDAASELDVLKIVKRNNDKFVDYELIDECLIKHFFMRSLDNDARNEIIKEMSLCRIDVNTYVFRQGSMGNFFYLIRDGECELFVNENHIKNLKAGDSFGELALLHKAPRSGSVRTIGLTYVWCLERKNFRKIVDHINNLNYEENKRFINSIPILVNIESDLKSILASNLMKVFFEKDETIVKGKHIKLIYIQHK